MYNIEKFIFCFVFITFFIVSCTNRNSTIGFPGTNIENHEMNFNNSVIKNMYTYEDSVRAFPGNTKLILGNYNDIEARILLRFTTLPQVKLEEDPIVILNINNMHYPKEFNIKIAAIKDNLFSENSATWDTYTGNATWDKPGGDFHEDEIMEISFNFAENDSISQLQFPIKKELVQSWIDRTIFDNYGIIIFTDNKTESFIEFYSTETFQPPRIRLSYLESDSLHIVYRNANNDTFIHDFKYTTLEEKDLIISNIPPMSLYLKIDIDYEDHKVDFNEKGIFSPEDLKRINVNQAYLYIPIDESNSMRMNDRFNLSIAIPHEYPFDLLQMWHYPATIDSLRNGEMRINVSVPMQQIISKNRPNNGLLILNNQHNMDFSHTQIIGKDENNLNIGPRLVLRYSVLK